MKNFLLFAFIFFAVVACNLDGHTEYYMTSTADFEFTASTFDADSLYLTAPFYGGSVSYSLVFNSMRENEGDPLTGGVCATMKRDSSLVLKNDNPYPQYTMYAVSAANNSNGCGVFYQNDDPELMPEHDIIFTNTEIGSCSPYSVMLNNSQQTVYDVLSEESPSKYEPGDYLKLTISGMAESIYTGALATTGSVDFYLVDWRGAKDEPDSVLTSWKTVSLTKLGEVEFVDFSIESNKENIIKTVCFDEFVAHMYIMY